MNSRGGGTGGARRAMAPQIFRVEEQWPPGPPRISVSVAPLNFVASATPEQNVQVIFFAMQIL